MSQGESEMNYVAHIRESDHQYQTVEEHLLGVKLFSGILWSENRGRTHCWFGWYVT